MHPSIHTLTALLFHQIDNSGLITFPEFAGLWKYIEDWRTCFQAFDKDRSGFIDFNELKTAMNSFGYNLSDPFLRLIIKKYDKRGIYTPPVCEFSLLSWTRLKNSKKWY